MTDFQSAIITGGTAAQRSEEAGRLAAARLGVPADVPHPDITVVRPLPDKSAILIDQCRFVRGNAYVRPNQADYRAFILDGPMDPRTQNVLLKILEEPPAHAFFILTADSPSDLLPTVRSRCAAVRLRSGPAEPSPRALELLALLRGGDMWALALFWKKREKLRRDDFFDFLDESCAAILGASETPRGGEPALVPKLRSLRDYYEFNTGTGLLCGLALMYCWEVQT